MKKVLFTILILAFATTVWAQGPFNDVPTDHWAYDAINKLQQSGILIGYPDGTFSGKRAVTRYEFAVALARLIDTINIKPGAVTSTTQNLSDYALKTDIPSLDGYAKLTDIPDVSKFATKADLDRISRLVNEFKDELAALGVDVDALKRDVAALDARVTILEEEMKRVKWTGSANVFAISPKNNYNGSLLAIDKDNISLQKSGLLDNISVVQDFDLNITGRVNTATSVVSTINYGSYLTYLNSVDDYAGGLRPTNKNNGLTDAFFPYYMYIDTACGKTAVSVGRFPLQFTPYTLKKTDVDSYTSILKTDDGNYPVDGIRTVCSLFGLDLTLYAAKHDNNIYLINGLTGQPNSGIGALNQAAGGHAVGGLNGLITQSAGARAKFGIPWGGNMGLTYYQAYSGTAVGNFDQARVFGADMSILLADRFNVIGSWTRSDSLAKTGTGSDVDYLNTAWDAKILTGCGKIGIGAGYKSIGRNFAAAGSWDKIGRWDNPTNVKGPYADFTYPLQSNLKVVLNGEWLTWKDDTTSVTGVWGHKDDKILKGEAGVKWGISSKNSLTAGYEYVQWEPNATGTDSATETYLTVGWAHDLGANAGLKVGYQFINYNNGDTGSGPYGGALANNYRGALGVVQFGVSF